MESLSVRVGYDAFSRNQSVTNTNATYDGSLKLNNGNALLVWSPGGHFFHVAVGAEFTGTKIDVTGVPVGGTFTLGNNSYPAADIASVTGSVKMGSGVAPYAGIGFGNPVGSGAHLTFQFDVGAVFTGTPTANLTVVCSAAGAAVCPQIQAAAQTEISNLESKTTDFKVWPVVNLGLAWRF